MSNENNELNNPERKGKSNFDRFRPNKFSTEPQIDANEVWFNGKEAAKQISEGLGKNKLMRILRKQGILSSKNKACQDCIYKGYLREITKDLAPINKTTTVVLYSDKGIAFLKSLLAQKTEDRREY